jgi:hypothetical protein
MAQANRTIIRIDQDGAPDKLEEIDISKERVKLFFVEFIERRKLKSS